MRDLLPYIDGDTETYGIIGNPVRHSRSPAMHNAGFLHLDLNCVYVPLPTSDIGDAVAGLKTLGFRGVSVTIPYKEDVIAHLDVIDPVAAKIGAVNTLVFEQDREESAVRVHGYNTDWLGANQALEEEITLRGSKVLILGAGGSARAIGFGLLEAGAGIMIANRTEDKGRKLAARLGCPFHRLEAMAEIRADALINATPVGMDHQDDRSPVPASLLSNFAVVMDIVYAPLQTRLLREAAAAGCATVDGLSMLLYQGAAQFKLWTGREAPLEVMRRVLFGEEEG
jgi:shikimate dehydrogenase